MIQQFHAGQDVEVTDSRYPLSTFSWRKAKIAGQVSVTYCGCDICNSGYEVQFPNGTRAVFDAAHIRAVRGKFDEWLSPPLSTATTEWSS